MTSFVCSACGKEHEGLAAWTLQKPDHWFSLTSFQRLRSKCGSDLCRTVDGHYFVRAVLELPLLNGPEPVFEFGVWGSLSKTNFERYSDTFDDNDQSKLGGMFSYLSNELRGFPDSHSLKASLHPRDLRKRPLMELEPTDHPLAVAQHDGIEFSKVLGIIH